MITVSFLSGELVQFDDLFEGATLYNLKRTICEWMEEKDGQEVDLCLVYLYDEENNELDNSLQITDQIYRVYINEYDYRIVYEKNGKAYYHRENDSRGENDPEVDSELCNTHNIKY